MRQPPPNIDQILAEHMSRQLDGKTGLRRKRIETAEIHLRRCIEELGDRIVTDGTKSLLELERQFCSDDAYGRILNAADLLFALEAYVREPWLLDDPRDRAVQLRFADALERLILAERLDAARDYGCVGLEIQAGIAKAKSQLSAQRLRAR